MLFVFISSLAVALLCVHEYIFGGNLDAIETFIFIVSIIILGFSSNQLF